MRGLQCTVYLVLVVAMLATATQAAPRTNASAGEPCPDAPNASGAARDMHPQLQRRFLGGLVRAATGIVGKVFGRGGAKVAAGAADDAAAAAAKKSAEAAAKKAAETAAKQADDAAKKAAEQAAKQAADDAARAARVAASKTGGVAGFVARTGLTKRKFFKEAAITIIATAALNKVFNSLTEKQQRKSLEEQTKNAVIAADLANRGELTAEEAEKLGVFFDPESGVLELPPGVKIAPPPGAESVAFADVVPGEARPGAAAAANPAVAAPPDPALLAQQTKNTKIALDLAAKKELTVEKAAELGLVFDPVAETLEVPEGVDLDALPDGPAPTAAPNVAPAA